MKDSFASYHPIINFGYFLFIIIFTVVSLNRISLLLLFLGGVCYDIYLERKKAIRFILSMVTIIIISATLFNGLFVGRGMVIFILFR